MKELRTPATVEKIEDITSFIDEELEKANCPMRARMQIDVAIDEIFGNIARYAYDHENGFAVVRIEIDQDPPCATITFIDEGKPFDPLKRDDPDVTLGVEERGIGGLGIFVVKKTMDEVDYRYDDGKNILTIKKTLT